MAADLESGEIALQASEKSYKKIVVYLTNTHFPMDKRLFIQAITKFSVGLVLVGLLLFLPAGSLQYWQGWLLIGILFVPMYMATTVLFLTMPLVLASPIILSIL